MEEVLADHLPQWHS